MSHMKRNRRNGPRRIGKKRKKKKAESASLCGPVHMRRRQRRRSDLNHFTGPRKDERWDEREERECARLLAVGRGWGEAAGEEWTSLQHLGPDAFLCNEARLEKSEPTSNRRRRDG